MCSWSAVMTITLPNESSAYPSCYLECFTCISKSDSCLVLPFRHHRQSQDLRPWPIFISNSLMTTLAFSSSACPQIPFWSRSWWSGCERSSVGPSMERGWAIAQGPLFHSVYHVRLTVAYRCISNIRMANDWMIIFKYLFLLPTHSSKVRSRLDSGEEPAARRAPARLKTLIFWWACHGKENFVIFPTNSSLRSGLMEWVGSPQKLTK